MLYYKYHASRTDVTGETINTDVGKFQLRLPKVRLTSNGHTFSWQVHAVVDTLYGFI